MLHLPNDNYNVNTLLLIISQCVLYSSIKFEYQVTEIKFFQLLGYTLEKLDPTSFTIDSIAKLEILRVTLAKAYGMINVRNTPD